MLYTAYTCDTGSKFLQGNEI